MVVTCFWHFEQAHVGSEWDQIRDSHETWIEDAGHRRVGAPIWCYCIAQATAGGKQRWGQAGPGLSFQTLRLPTICANLQILEHLIVMVQISTLWLQPSRTTFDVITGLPFGQERTKAHT
jgi:hypothetical protein